MSLARALDAAAESARKLAPELVRVIDLNRDAVEVAREAQSVSDEAGGILVDGEGPTRFLGGAPRGGGFIGGSDGGSGALGGSGTGSGGRSLGGGLAEDGQTARRAGRPIIPVSANGRRVDGADEKFGRILEELQAIRSGDLFRDSLRDSRSR